MTELEKKIIEAFENDTIYDFIANHYMELTKTQLKDIILESLYCIHLAERGRIGRYEITDSIIEELDSRWNV